MAEPAKHRVYLVGEHPVCRHGMAQLINNEADLVVCGESGSLEQASAALETAKPDLLILELHKKGEPSVQLVRDVCAARPPWRLLVVSSTTDSPHVLEVLRAGAQGYVMKSEALHDFLAAIRKVLSGELYLHRIF